MRDGTGPIDDDLLRPLYQAPPGEFVAARTALARRLRAAGDPRAAAAARALRKPPLSAWAVSRLFAREADRMAALVATGERIRAAQKVASGGGDARPLRDLLAGVREQTAGLTRRGAELLAESEGRAPGEAIVERLRGSLEALALDPAAAPVAARGWLDADLDPPGFELLAALQVAAAGAQAPAGAKKRPAPRRAAAPIARLDDRRRAIAERRERERRERIERLRAELEGAEAEAAARQADADRAAALAEEAAAALAAARRRAAEAASAAEKARRRAADARAAAEHARAALTAAEDEAEGKAAP